jgi:endonuclease YncB( thermonuclease family)
VFEYFATVERIVDGDTIDLNVDVGFRIWNRDRFRLYGIDTPERGQSGWAEASAELARLIPVGSTVRIVTAKPPRDKYGRWLATIFAGDINVNEALVANGFAVVYLP